MKLTYLISTLCYLVVISSTQAFPGATPAKQTAEIQESGNSSPSELRTARKSWQRLDRIEMLREKNLAHPEFMYSKRAGYKNEHKHVGHHPIASEWASIREKDKRKMDQYYHEGLEEIGDYYGMHQAHQSRLERLTAKVQREKGKAKAKLDATAERAGNAVQAMFSSRPGPGSSNSTPGIHHHSNFYSYNNDAARSSSASSGDESSHDVYDPELSVLGGAFTTGVGIGDYLTEPGQSTSPSSHQTGSSWFCGLGWCGARGDGSSSPPHGEIPSLPKVEIPAPDISLSPGSDCGRCIGACIGGCCEACFDALRGN